MKLPIKVNDLKNKVIVITGAGGVLCSTMAIALAEAGAKVALLDRSDKAQEFANEITANGGTAKAYIADVLKKESLAKCHTEIIKRLRQMRYSHQRRRRKQSYGYNR